MALGGALGALMRYGWVTLFPVQDTAFPLAIFTENILGAHTVTTGSAWAGDVDPEYHTTWVILSVGFAGSYTTFSGWMVQTAELVEAGDLKDALLNLLLSIVPGILLTLAGIRIGMML
jgi:fluoride exporter